MAELLVKGGTVVLPTGSFKADILADQGKVVGIFRDGLERQSEKVVDATGMYVLPGGIDPHVHFNVPFMGTKSRHDFIDGTIGAAFGGTTTVIDFAIQKEKSFLETVEDKIAEGVGKAVIDFSIHGTPTKTTPHLEGDVRKVIEMGIPSFKLFMIYRKEGWMMDDGGLYSIMEVCRDAGGLVAVHAENAAIAEYRTEKLLREGKTHARYHYDAKPNFVEAEAINRAIFMAKQTGAALYIVHMSTKEGEELVRHARGEGQPVYSETCTHYLIYTREYYDRPLGHRMLLSPPLRNQEDQDAMWAGLAKGSIQSTGSDDSAYDTDAKDHLGDSFANTPNGCPGVEIRLPVIWHNGINSGKLTPEKFVAVTSTNIAKIYGLYPQKGTIAVGSDADMVVWDPKKEFEVKYDNLHMKCGWSPVEGMLVKGWPIVTISKGDVIIENGQFVGKVGHGEFLHRKIDSQVLTGPSV